MGKPKKGECRELMAEIRQCNQSLNESLRLNDGKKSVDLARRILNAAEDLCTTVEDRYLSPEEIAAMERAAELEAAEEGLEDDEEEEDEEELEDEEEEEDEA